MTCEIRLGRVVGLPVIYAGRLLGHVEQAVPDGEGRLLTGLVIRRGLRGARWASRADVGVLGEVSVVLTHPPQRPPRRMQKPWGLVKDENGLTLGRVTDMWLRPGTLEVTALEVSLGPLEDMKYGRLRVEDWAMRPGGNGQMQVQIARRSWEGAQAGKGVME